MNVSIIIVCGGNSSRMGTPKYALPWGAHRLLEHLIIECESIDCDDILLVSSPSLRDGANYLYKDVPTVEEIGNAHPSVRVVYDKYEGIGPLGALEVGLRDMRHNYGLVIATDMPHMDVSEVLKTYKKRLTSDLEGKLSDQLTEPYAYIPIIDGQMMPFGAIYHKDIYIYVKEAIHKGQYSVTNMLRNSPIATIPMNELTRCFQNVNYPLEYACALWQSMNLENAVKILSVSAVHSKTGKTTVVEGLTKYFTKCGKQVGFVKSTHHVVDKEVKGSDTWKVTRAGAKEVVLVGPTKGQVNTSNELVKEAYGLHVDIGIIESRTKAVGPIIVVAHGGWDQEDLQRWMFDYRVVALVCSENERELLAAKAKDIGERARDQRKQSSKGLEEETHVHIVTFEEVEALGKWLLEKVL